MALIPRLKSAEYRKWHFYSPSRGRTRQLKADTVALAKTWQGTPHTVAEMFPGENPAPNTCTSPPARQPLNTQVQVHNLRRQNLFTENSSHCFLSSHACALNLTGSRSPTSSTSSIPLQPAGLSHTPTISNTLIYWRTFQMSSCWYRKQMITHSF